MPILKTTQAAALLALTLLAGCGTSDKFAPQCPQLAILKDAADLTRFNGRGQDITDLELDVRLAAVPAACSLASRGKVHAEMYLVAELTRGPAKRDRNVSIGYFVAVTDPAGRLLDKQSYTADVAFPPNGDRVNLQTDPIMLDFPVSEKMQAADYKIYVGLTLTAAEVAYNRKVNGTP